MSDCRRSLNSLDDIEFAVRRIDELEADLRKMALDYLAAQGQAADAYEAQLAAEAKLSKSEALLAKAVEIALEECPFLYGTGSYNHWCHNRRATLVELSGNSQKLKVERGETDE